MKVKDIPKEATFHSDSQDVEDLRDRFGIDKTHTYDSYFTYNTFMPKIWGIRGIISSLDKEATQLLTNEDKRLYIKSPNYCPYCGSLGISSHGINFDDEVNCDVICDDCNKTWNDKYEVVRIETYED